MQPKSLSRKKSLARKITFNRCQCSFPCWSRDKEENVNFSQHQQSLSLSSPFVSWVQISLYLTLPAPHFPPQLDKNILDKYKLNSLQK